MQSVLAVVAGVAVAAVALARVRERSHLRLRRRAEAELVAAQDVQRATFDALDEGIVVVAAGGEVVLTNAAARRLLGAVDMAELAPSSWVLLDERGRRIPPDEHPTACAAAIGEPVRDRVAVWRGSEGDVTLRISAVPLRHGDAELAGVVTAFADVTAERAALRERALSEAQVRAAEAELEAERVRFTALVERSSDLICVVDGLGALQYASPAGERLLAFPPGSNIGRSFFELIHPDDVERVAAEFVELVASPGSERASEFRVMTADGEWRHMEIAAINRLDDPAVGGVVATARDVTARVEEAAELTRRAFHDELTGVGNRAMLHDRLGHALARRRDGECISVLYLDLDGFKSINDAYGHDGGDAVLVEVAQRLTSTLRESDTIARFGGDEFVVVAESLSTPAAAEDIARRLLSTASQPLLLAGVEVPVGISIGIACAQGASSPEELLRRADIALYEAKRSGKGRYEVHVDARVATAR